MDNDVATSDLEKFAGEIEVHTIQRLYAETPKWQKPHGHEINSVVRFPTPLLLPKGRNPFVPKGLVVPEFWDTPSYEALEVYVLTEMGPHSLRTDVEVELNFRRQTVSGELGSVEAALTPEQRVDLLVQHHDGYLTKLVQLYRFEGNKGVVKVNITLGEKD